MNWNILRFLKKIVSYGIRNNSMLIIIALWNYYQLLLTLMIMEKLFSIISNDDFPSSYFRSQSCCPVF